MQYISITTYVDEMKRVGRPSKSLAKPKPQTNAVETSPRVGGRKKKPKNLCDPCENNTIKMPELTKLYTSEKPQVADPIRKFKNDSSASPKSKSTNKSNNSKCSSLASVSRKPQEFNNQSFSEMRIVIKQEFSQSQKSYLNEYPYLESYSSEELADFMRKIFPYEAKLLYEQDIDGQTLLTMTKIDFKEIGLKWGPALRLYNFIVDLQTKKHSNSAIWVLN